MLLDSRQPGALVRLGYAKKKKCDINTLFQIDHQFGRNVTIFFSYNKCIQLGRKKLNQNVNIFV